MLNKSVVNDVCIDVNVATHCWNKVAENVWFYLNTRTLDDSIQLILLYRIHLSRW